MCGFYVVSFRSVVMIVWRIEFMLKKKIVRIVVMMMIIMLVIIVLCCVG